jgi:hypothetical protein
MAKDAKGHGSEARGGSGISDALKTYNQRRIAGEAQTRADEAKSRAAAGNAMLGISDKDAASTLAQGSAKSAPVDVHPAQVGQMKMSAGDFAKLSAAVTPHLASTANPAHSDTRQRWDAMWKSGFDTTPLYKAGLNDAHIDTALRRIQGKK